MNEYFYGQVPDDFKFYRIPRCLITDPFFQGLSAEAKLLYGILLDRMTLSAMNNWTDDHSRTYIFYDVSQIQTDLQCGRNKARKLLSELEKEPFHLIERVRRGQGLPSRIYVKKVQESKSSANGPSFTHQIKALKASKNGSRKPQNSAHDVPKEDIRTLHGGASGLPKSNLLDYPNWTPNYTEGNYTEGNYTEVPSPAVAREAVRDELREQLDFYFLAQNYPYEQVDGIIELLCDVLTDSSPVICIGNRQVSASLVRERFGQLDGVNVSSVLETLNEPGFTPKNIKAYLLSALYNAPIVSGLCSGGIS